MAHLLRPLFHLPRWRYRRSAVSQLLSFHSAPGRATTCLPFSTLFSSTCRQVHSRARALKLRDSPPFSDANESGDELSDGGDVKKSRNERKREARRAVRWGMDLANFSPSQIKRIVRVAELEQEVFEAIMVVKRLGSDVREGKRRQYNYIGKLLLGVEPELMDGLIQAIKDGDLSKFQELSGTELAIDNDAESEEEISEEEEEEEEDYTNMAVVTRWFDGLVNKDLDITNEIYSLREVDFDRQELRQLVRKVQCASAQDAGVEGRVEADANAGRSLTRFLRGLADQLPDE
ncbi:uncharacterized protein LOC121782414 [Salvia splendens]|uniref:uncharacterized protein LOC121782414 n=1 Tax=Salvia splendens TaxID=180675 RepID=UPI001C2690AB|nr:uncharacterized protein LOC121782414 [Salvia splendens]